MKYDFDLEDHSKKRKEIFLRVLLCALEIGVVLFVAYAITHFGLEKMTQTFSECRKSHSSMVPFNEW